MSRGFAASVKRLMQGGERRCGVGSHREVPLAFPLKYESTSTERHG